MTSPFETRVLNSRSCALVDNSTVVATASEATTKMRRSTWGITPSASASAPRRKVSSALVSDVSPGWPTSASRQWLIASMIDRPSPATTSAHGPTTFANITPTAPSSAISG